MIEFFDGIKRAALEISLDNGGINRDRSIEQMTKELDDFLEKTKDVITLFLIDAWLRSLSEEDMNTVCAGGQDEPETIELMSKAPSGTNELLNEIFEQVC
jgi:hypothetical protein